jgi:hypothetical protein
LLVEFVTEKVHAIGPAEIVEPVSVNISNPSPIRLVNYRSDFELILNIALVLKGNAMRVHKRKI